MTTNRARFYSDYSTLDASAVGVTFIRTREPFRALDTLREWAYAQPLPFKLYSMLNGWNTFDPQDPTKAPTTDGVLDLAQAISMIDAVRGGDPMPDGVYAIMWPHFMLNKVPAIIQMIAELSRSCSENSKRVALVVPLAFEVPSELQDSIPVLDFDLPNREELLESYHRVLESVDQNKRPQYGQSEVDRILNTLVGMTEMEAESAISRAMVLHRAKLPAIPLDDFVGVLMKVKVEAIKRSETLEVIQTERMEDVGGLDNLKHWVSARRPAFTKEAADAGVDRPKGVLLVGPPGTAKSLSAKAIAHALGMPLIKFDISRLFAGLVGASEGRTREALKLIHAQAPCVAFVDEIDKAVSKEGGNDGGVAKRVFGTILSDMSDNNDGVFWVLTANRVDNLPSELVRAGRIDEKFAVMPPEEDERREILHIHLRKRKENPAEIPDLELAVARSAGFVGAEVEQAVKEAKTYAFSEGIPVTGALIAEQFGQMKPLSEAFAEDFAAMSAWAENNARPASSKRAAARARTRARPDGGAAPSTVGSTRRRLAVAEPGGLDS